MAVRLSQDDINRIKSAMVQGRSSEVVLYQAPDYNSSIRAVDTRTGAVNASNALGDVAHLLLHGVTLGGMMHMAVRDSSQEANWNSITSNAKNRAVENHLSWFENSPCTQLAILGGKYITLYEKGEYQRRTIEFKDVVQICFGPKGLTYITKNIQKPGSYNAYIIHSNVGFLDNLTVKSIENCLRAFNQGGR